MKCPKCGQDNPEGSIFCSQCGTSLNQKVQLSDPDKQRIAEEEKERLKVQDELKKTKRKKNLKFTFLGCGGAIVLVIIIAIIIGATSSGSKSNANNQTIVNSTAAAKVTTTATKVSVYSGPEVEYKIGGTSTDVDVTLENATGGTEQYNDVSTGQTYSFQSFPDDYMYISAQNQQDSGTVIVSIYLNGVLDKTSSSSGAYVIASASDMK